MALRSESSLAGTESKMTMLKGHSEIIQSLSIYRQAAAIFCILTQFNKQTRYRTKNVELPTHAGHHAGSYLGTWKNLRTHIGNNLSINLHAKQHAIHHTMREPM